MPDSPGTPDAAVSSRHCLHPSARDRDPLAGVRELSEQIYTLPLFSPEFCGKLIETADAADAWEAGLRKPFYQPSQEAPPLPNALKNGFTLKERPELTSLYVRIVDERIAPVIDEIWETFEMHLYQTPYVVRYAADDDAIPAAMPLHWDQCAVSLFVALDEDYDGGGTRFPTHRFETGRLPVGTALLFPGGIAHPHEAAPVTRGKRRVLVGAFF